MVVLIYIVNIVKIRVEILLVYFATLFLSITSFLALMLVQENVIAMIEGNHINTSDACALSAVTGIPVISLNGDTRPTDECVKTVQIQAGYRTYAHATLDILNTFQWKNIALLYEGKPI